MDVATKIAKQMLYFPCVENEIKKSLLLLTLSLGIIGKKILHPNSIIQQIKY